MTLFTMDILSRGQMNHIRVLGYNLLIRPRVQLYFYSGTFYIINGNFGLVKS